MSEKPETPDTETPPVPDLPVKPKKEKVAPKPQAKPVEETVWMSCRAKQGCEGKQAKVVFRKRTGGGGVASRFRCLACGGSFHINT